MKKIFRLSAIVAMLSMMATATVTTACSDDDDDENPVQTDTIFTVSMGGKASSAGSYLSIKNCEVYTTSTLGSHAKDVEIVFDGSNFKTAGESTNAQVSENGLSATIENVSPTSWSFTTSTGYMGSISIPAGQEVGDASATYTVTVARKNAN